MLWRLKDEWCIMPAQGIRHSLATRMQIKVWAAQVSRGGVGGGDTFCWGHHRRLKGGVSSWAGFYDCFELWIVAILTVLLDFTSIKLVVEGICLLTLTVSSVVSNSFRPHGLQHARPPCPSPTPGTYSNSCPSSQWYHPTISSSVVPFSSYLQSWTWHFVGSFKCLLIG